MKAEDWVGRWAGRTVVCLASGPSLTERDALFANATGVPTIVTNTTFRMCPWADVLMGHDAKWWKAHQAEVDSAFGGHKLTCSPSHLPGGVRSLRAIPQFKSFENSGCAAISLAVLGRAARVVLLGYDCQPAADGRKHWHADHPEPLSNAVTIDRWTRKFELVAAYARKHHVPVQNASRETALRCFPRVELESVFCPEPEIA